jgi:putative flippase GtrA
MALLARIDPAIGKYIVVGLGTNGIGYLLYLLITWLGMGHKSAMTLLYLIGIIVNFYLNRRWTFKAQGSARNGFLRFLLVVVVGYILNLFWLVLFVDTIGLRHQLVQAAVIPVMAVYFFVANKYFVHTHVTSKRTAV